MHFLLLKLKSNERKESCAEDCVVSYIRCWQRDQCQEMVLLDDAECHVYESQTLLDWFTVGFKSGKRLKDLKMSNLLFSDKPQKKRDRRPTVESK